jgi:hypothetical protein
MSREFLYRRSGLAVIVILALLAGMAPRAAAQGKPQLKRPEPAEEKLPEAKKPKKNVKGPRAVALLQLTASGKATLIPIAILVDGRFYDASVYKADPVPMALDSGTVYEAERAGDSLGLFTVSAALHSNTRSSAHPWVGSGSYLPNGTEAAKTTRKAEDVPVGIGSSSASDEPPRLSRGKSSKPAEASSPAPATGSSAPAGSGSDDGSNDRPRLTRGDAAKPAEPSSPAPAPGSSTPAGAGSSEKPAAPPAADKPADQSGKPQAPGQSSSGQSPSGQSSPGQSPPSANSQAQASPGPASGEKQSENYYRPTLRRGKTTQAAPQEDPSLVGKPKSESKAGESKAGKPESSEEASTGAASVQLVPAISDGGGPDPRSYKFFWKTGEEEERRTQMVALAAAEVQAYASALAKNRIPANPPAAAKTPAKGHKAPPKPAQPELENIQFRAFDVWVTNQPVMILTAEAHLPAAPGTDATPEQYSITLAARTDIYGNLRKLYSGVTDKFHLDVTPRLELIDVVDADGDGRGELLFREITDAGSGYVIYRATADKLWKMFDSLAE